MALTHPASTSLPGRLLAGRYRLEKRLGRGSCATVYSALDQRFNRSVVVKLFDASIAADPRLRARFQQQAAKASRLRHPNIATVLDAGVSEDESGGTELFVVTEPAGTQSLRQYLEHRRLRAAHAVRLVQQIASALQYAHEHGVIHADIKPENVIVDDHGRNAHLVDFSLSFVAARTGVVTRETLARRAAYLAPEQVRGEAIDPRTDVYGLGVMLYEMVVGRPPFVGESPLATAERRVYEQAKPAGVFEPSIPPALEQIIGKALERAPEQRWASVEELDRALLKLSPEELLPAPAVGEPLAALSSSSRERRRGRGPGGFLAAGIPLLAASLVALLAIALLVPLLGRGPWFALTVGGVEVPDLTGMNIDAARELASKQGLQLRVLGERPSDRLRRGEILEQAPITGRLSDTREPIRVTLSAGVQVPDVRGMSVENATAALARLNWKVGKVERGQYPGSPAGTVVLQYPPPGELADSPGELLLAVAE